MAAQSEGRKMQEITTNDELNECLERSKEAPLFVFKHSTRCPISARANSRVAEYLQSGQENIPGFYMLKVVESRALSLALADRVGVEHQSPQLLLIDQGQCTWNTSHHNINAENIEEAIGGSTA